MLLKRSGAPLGTLGGGGGGGVVLPCRSLFGPPKDMPPLPPLAFEVGNGCSGCLPNGAGDGEGKLEEVLARLFGREMVVRKEKRLNVFGKRLWPGLPKSLKSPWLVRTLLGGGGGGKSLVIDPSRGSALWPLLMVGV